MKKLFLAGAMALFGAMNAQQGHFKAGAHVALPVGDLADAYSFSVGLDLGYMFKVAPNFELGAVTGYSHLFGKTIEATYLGVTISGDVKDSGFIPLAASAKFNVVPDFFIGADLGAAFLTEEGAGTAFYYNPKIGYQFSKNELALSYQGFSKNSVNLGAVALGYNYNF